MSSQTIILIWYHLLREPILLYAYVDKWVSMQQVYKTEHKNSQAIKPSYWIGTVFRITGQVRGKQNNHWAGDK